MPTPFAPTTLAELASRLEHRRRASSHLACRLHEDAARALEDLDRSDFFDSQSPDGGSNDIDRARSLQLAGLASGTATAADRALQRIAAGTYGICDGCSQRIPLARLRAMPETHLCVGCKVEGRGLALAG